ncbi:MAG: nucleotide sugar dehydrogenase, partial [Deltaproteobacteria bacterium]|nr:nucleotide sugar dehydrogenase [Deltaproteobacteria bacterium]
MKITIVGTGYVGLVTGACLADTGNDVWCVDKNSAKIDGLKKGDLPIYEPGLDIIVSRNAKDGRLVFTTSLLEAIANSDICFLTVDTPSNDTGAADLTNVMAVAGALGEILTQTLLVVTKSTVPVGTTAKVKKAVQNGLTNRGLDTGLVAVASNPEFLKEGTAVQDFRYPDRVVVGVERPQDVQKLRDLYAPFMRKHDCFLPMDVASSELCKYAANAMLATRISFMNEMSQLCEKVGANITPIRTAMGMDPRIGSNFLYAGLGYG